MVDNAPQPTLACTEEAKRVLEDVIQRKPDSVVALLYGRRNSEDQEHWYIGYYEKPTSQQLADSALLAILNSISHKAG